MARTIVIVNATQIITSTSNPSGLYSVMPGFPKVFDSGTDGDIEQNMKSAKSAYYAQLSANYANTNPNRVMTTVTLEMASGEQILKECIGAFPAIEPEPAPEEPEEEPTESE